MSGDSSQEVICDLDKTLVEQDACPAPGDSSQPLNTQNILSNIDGVLSIDTKDFSNENLNVTPSSVIASTAREHSDEITVDLIPAPLKDDKTLVSQTDILSPESSDNVQTTEVHVKDQIGLKIQPLIKTEEKPQSNINDSITIDSSPEGQITLEDSDSEETRIVVENTPEEAIVIDSLSEPSNYFDSPKTSSEKRGIVTRDVDPEATERSNLSVDMTKSSNSSTSTYEQANSEDLSIEEPPTKRQKLEEEATNLSPVNPEEKEDNESSKSVADEVKVDMVECPQVENSGVEL